MINFVKIKRSDGKLLSIWWFAILTIIAVGVVSGTLIFFSNKIDVRLYESDVLANKIVKCLAPNGFIDELFLKDTAVKPDILERCNLNKNRLDAVGSNYFIKISVFDSVDSLARTEVQYGNGAFDSDCKVGAAVDMAGNFPRCLERNISVLNSNKEILRLKIIAGSNYEYRLGERT